jgi:hypothetical protein
MIRISAFFTVFVCIIPPLQASYFGSWKFVPLQGQPHDVVFDSSKDLAYVSNRSLGRIDIVSVASSKVDSSIAVGEMPMGLTLTNDGSRLYTTLYNLGKMAEVDLSTKTVIRTINLPEGVWWGQPLRVDFDAFGHCYWRDGGDGNPYGYLYSLNLESGQSTQLLTSMSPLRYAFTHNKNRMLVVTTGSGAGVTIFDTQTQTTLNPATLPDFCIDWWCWPVEGITNDQTDRILVTKSVSETHLFGGNMQRLGIINVGMGWGTFGPWSDMALIVEAQGGTPLNRISFLDTNAIAIQETLILPEAIGIGDAYDYGSKPIDLSRDGKILLAVGQTGLYIIPA